MYVNHKSSRGQVLVLACVTMLLTALMLLLSLNLANAVHERVRLQAAADSQAFSIATMEARALNTMAYNNRAIAGALVAEMGLHAWWAIAEHDYGMLNAGGLAFIIVAIMEFAQCPKFNIQHCIHGFQALRISAKYYKEGRNYKNNLEDQQDKFDTAVEDIAKMIKDLHGDQEKFLARTKTEIQMGANILSSLKGTNAPKASMGRYIGMIAKYNTSDLACAVEGTDIDDDCDAPSWDPAGDVLGESERADVMNSAAMAARTTFEEGTWQGPHVSNSDFNYGFPIGFAPIPIYNPQKMKDIQSEGTYLYLYWGKTKGQVSNGTETVSANVPRGLTVVQWKHGAGVGFPGGGSQSTTKPDREYYGSVCDEADNCFVNYRAIDSDADQGDWGQPNTYGLLTQSLREMRKGPSEKPWELNSGGTVQVDVGGGKQLKVQLVARDDAVAVAKGKVFFHQLGQWKQPPNLFDPFWRAKLHAFKREELKEILQRGGDIQGSIVAGSAPVEGKR